MFNFSLYNGFEGVLECIAMKVLFEFHHTELTSVSHCLLEILELTVSNLIMFPYQ